MGIQLILRPQIQLLLLMMHFYERGLAVIKAGAPLSKIVSLPVRDEIVRLKSTVPNDRLELIKETESRFEQQFSELERMYCKV